MLRWLLILVILVASGSDAQTIAEPEGRWRLEGHNPNGTPYSGMVQVTPRGSGYVVRWRIGDRQSFVGWGLRSSDSFAVAYSGGLALYVVEGEDRLVGTWSYLRDGRLGVEIWTRDEAREGQNG